MAKRSTSFTLQRAAITDAVVEGVMAYIEDRGNQSETGTVLDYVSTNSTTFDEIQDEIDLYFNTLEEELDNPDATNVELVEISGEDEDSIVLSTDLDVEENEPEDAVQDMADNLQGTAPVSDSATLLAVLNRMGLSVSKKNRILAIVGE